MRPLTPGELDDACKKVLANATNLLSDAELLLINGRAPRAYSLVILACEEIAKLPMLRRASTCLALGQRVDWKKLGKRLRQHESKLGLLDVIAFIMEDFPDDHDAFVAAIKKRGRDSKLVSEMNRKKQAGLYVSILHDKVESPDDAVSLEVAENYVAGAKKLIAMFAKGEEVVGMAVTQMHADPEVRKAMAIRIAEDFAWMFER